MTGSKLSWAGRLVRPALFAAAGLFATAAQSQPSGPVLSPADLPIVMSAYVDSVVEWRQFYIACATDPEGWDQGSALLSTSLEAAGAGSTQIASWTSRLAAGTDGAVAYDCEDEAATFRKTVDRPANWSAYHTMTLQRLGLKIVATDDPRADAVRAVFDRYVPMQKKVLNCMALTLPQIFTLAYSDWNAQLDKAGAEMVAASLPLSVTSGLIAGARSAALMQPVGDRHAEVAACVKSTDWQDWWGMFQPFAFKGDVVEALGGKR